MRNLSATQRTLLLRMALLSYGTVQQFGGRAGESTRIGPPGESKPMHEDWAAIFTNAPMELMEALTEQAQAEFDAYIRRPLAHDTTETMEELNARIVADGWGVTTADCSRAMRCTGTMVRRARLAALRHPETGYRLPAAPDPLSWAIELDGLGLSLRQIEAITGVPKSTLHDRIGRTRRPSRGLVADTSMGRVE